MSVAVEQSRAYPLGHETVHPAQSHLRRPLILGNKSYTEVTEDICRLLDHKPGAGWWAALGIAATLLIAGLVAITYTITTGIGTWGLNKTV